MRGLGNNEKHNIEPLCESPNLFIKLSFIRLKKYNAINFFRKSDK